MDIAKLPPKVTGERLTRNSTWREIAAHLTEIEGHHVSHQSACESGKKLLKRLKHKFLEDPELKAWLLEQGFYTENQ